VELKGRKVVVLGLGDTGLSLARWLARREADVRVADSRADPPHAATLARELPRVALARGAFGEATLRGADLIAISPGLDRREPPVAGAIRRGVPVVGDIELFAQALKERVSRQSTAASDSTPRTLDSDSSAALRAAGGQIPARERGPSSAPRRAPVTAPKVLAITGSNGKSTVTAMTGEILRAAGRQTVVAGNIGTPVLDTLGAIEDGAAAPEVFVLELSSFQLESTASLEPAAAAMLNLTEDHLDRYAGMADYAAAKARVFAGDGIQVLNRDDRWSMGMARKGRTVFTFGGGRPRAETEWGIRGAGGVEALARGPRDLMTLSELPVAGLHNAANALAAHALAHSIGAPDEALAQALRSFQGLPHRMQKVAEHKGVQFLDDSKGTNVGATVAALAGLRQPVVLIAGGDGKGQDFAPLAPAVKARARAVVLIGRDAEKLAQALAASGVPIERATGMDDAVRAAFHASRAGDAVLLSPACASYDMFRDYVHRAEVYVAAVRRLAGSGA
jgi:UDP-N-acetylmuramoylalanine--D-glutamate ligase